jgi:hypothetical protein
LAIPFSKEEYVLLESSQLSMTEAAEVSEMVRLRAQRLAPLGWWSFFQLGVMIGSLTHHLESSRPIRQIRDQLNDLQDDRFIQQDRLYAGLIDDLLVVLSAFDETSSGSERQAVMGRVSTILNELPPVGTGSRESAPLVSTSEWFWIQDGSDLFPMCMAGDYGLVARGSWEYEVSGGEDPERHARVARDQSGWCCSVHPDASEDEPCFDIQLVFDHTDSGAPVTEAKLILVRTGADGRLEVLEP